MDELLTLGLSTYEAKAYEYLIKQHCATASEISKFAQIPQGRIYTVLGHLTEKGLCYISAGSVKRYHVLDPEKALNSFIQKKQQEVETTQRLKSNLAQIYRSHEANNNPVDYFQLLTSKQSQVEKFDDLIARSNTQLYSFNRKPYATGFKRKKAQIEAASQVLIETISRGTDVKAIFEAETPENHTDFFQMLDYYHSIGEQIRIAPSLPMKMLLADGNVAMISLKTKGEQRFNVTSMVVEHTDLTKGLTDLFEFYWEKAIPYQTYKNQHL